MQIKKEAPMEPYPKLVRSLVVQQLTQSGWVDVIRFPLATPEDATPEQIQKSIEAISQLIYNSEKAHMSIQGIFVSFTGLENGTTIRVCASYTPAEEPFTVP